MEVKWTSAIKTAKTKSDRDKAIQKYKHQQIKDALSQMFHDKCAYCESYIANVSFGDIEHYKPKLKFSHLAVSWNNFRTPYPSQTEVGVILNMSFKSVPGKTVSV